MCIRDRLRALTTFPDIAKPLRFKIINDFWRYVRKPMMIQKNRDIEIFCKNSKYSSLYNKVEISPTDYYDLMQETVKQWLQDSAVTENNESIENQKQETQIAIESSITSG